MLHFLLTLLDLILQSPRILQVKYYYPQSVVDRMDMLLHSALAFVDNLDILVRRSMVRSADTGVMHYSSSIISYLIMFSTWQVAKHAAEAKLQGLVNALHQAEAQNFLNSSFIEVRHSY